MNDLSRSQLIKNVLNDSLGTQKLAKEPAMDQYNVHTNLDINSSKMGRILLYNGKITNEEVKAIIRVQHERGLRFGDAAVALGLVDQEDINAVLATQFAYTAPPAIDSQLDKQLVTAFQPDGLHAEALRSLRSELLLRYFSNTSSLGNPHSSPLALALVGAEDAAGTALMAANLAICFAQLGMRTLLIDANLRQPHVHTLFGLDKRQAGLSDLLAGRATPQPTEIAELSNLWVLGAGTQAPNPQELLANQHYAAHMDSLKTGFAVTLINTAPMNRTRDAQLVAANAGAALLIAQEHKSRFKDVEHMSRNLQGLGVRVLGVALRQ